MTSRFLKAITPTIVRDIEIPLSNGKQHLRAHWVRNLEANRLLLLAEMNLKATAIGQVAIEAQGQAMLDYAGSSIAKIRQNLVKLEEIELVAGTEQAAEIPVADRDELLLWSEYRIPLEQSLTNVLSVMDSEHKAGNSLPASANGPAMTAKRA